MNVMSAWVEATWVEVVLTEDFIRSAGSWGKAAIEQHMGFRVVRIGRTWLDDERRRHVMVEVRDGR